METGPLIVMMLVLKIPVLAAFAIIWWAVKQTPPQPEPGPSGPSGGSKTPPPPAPRRRGPHDQLAPDAPARVRLGSSSSKSSKVS
jgi:hypothetical protein